MIEVVNTPVTIEATTQENQVTEATTNTMTLSKTHEEVITKEEHIIVDD